MRRNTSDNQEREQSFIQADFFDAFRMRGNNVIFGWTGNNGWLIGAGEHLIATDLDYFNPLRKWVPHIPLMQIAENLNFHIVTHWHEDHFNSETCRFLQDHGACMFILPVSCRKAAQNAGILEERIRWIHPGDVLALVEWLQVRALRAIHGHMRHSVYELANLDDCGYVLDFHGIRIMQPGDTVLLQEHLETKDIDVLFVSPTEHNTHIEGSREMIGAIRPKYVFTQHFNTYHADAENSFWTEGFPDELAESLPADLRERVSIPVPDGMIRVVAIR